MRTRVWGGTKPPETKKSFLPGTPRPNPLPFRLSLSLSRGCGRSRYPYSPLIVTSQLGLDYSLLRDLLAAGEWEKADDETRLKLIEMAGEEAVIRGWVYFTEVKDIPIADLRTVDDLWLSYSKGRYGYSVQKKAWVKSRKVWTKFFQEIDWVQGENNAYRKWPLEFNWVADAKKGHLPLTNALRGTQLLQAVLEHPAFEEKKKKKVNTSATTSVKI